MTVALVLATQPDAGLPDAKLRGQLAALGVRRVDAAGRAGPGLLTVAAAARAAGERVLICVGDDSPPEEVLARLLGAGGTAAFAGSGTHAPHTGGALVVDPAAPGGPAGGRSPGGSPARSRGAWPAGRPRASSPRPRCSASRSVSGCWPRPGSPSRPSGPRSWPSRRCSSRSPRRGPPSS